MPTRKPRRQPAPFYGGIMPRPPETNTATTAPEPTTPSKEDTK